MMFIRQTAPTAQLHAVEPDGGLRGGVVRGGLRRRPAAEVPARSLQLRRQ